MKIKMTFVLLALVFYANVPAQLTGSGKIASKAFDYQNFENIQLTDLNGTVIIDVGKPWSINIDIDDNLEALLKVEQDTDRLKISLANNQNNKLYVENTTITIRISLPKASSITNDGNSNVTVNNLRGGNFKLKNTSNSDFYINGAVDKIQIVKGGNGDINGKNLNVIDADIACYGNGNVSIYCDGMIKASISGNGGIVNFGNGRFTADSTTSGNGKLKNHNR